MEIAGVGCPGELGWTVLSEPDGQRGVVWGKVVDGWEPVSVENITVHRVIDWMWIHLVIRLLPVNWFRSENGEMQKL